MNTKRALFSLVFLSLAFASAFCKTTKKSKTNFDEGVSMEQTIYSFTTKEIEITNSNSSNILRGTLYLPDISKNKKVPLIITSHELGGNATMPWWKNYASHWACEGIAVFAFDFAGGGEKSRSDGNTTNMSVLTEADDLETVFTEAKKWDFVNTSKIILAGGSQGGGVASIVASKNQKELAALILLYPAFYLPDDLHQKFPDLSQVPDVHRRNGMINVGRRFVKDMYDYDYFANMPDFKKPVLIVHGDSDKTAPHSYSVKAAGLYPNATLYTVKGAGHIFITQEYQEEFLQQADKFLKENKII